MIIIRNLKKVYSAKGEKVGALKGINLKLGNKGFVVLLGKSGSGKSTLLNILGGLDRFDEGEIIIKDKSTNDFNASAWDSYRNTYVGFIFQEFYIIDELTIGKNISLALELQSYAKEKIDEKVDEILRQVDLEGFKARKPNEISGGQKQRIAIARALVKDPKIILADEPTGNLDSDTGRLILETLKKLSKDKLIIMVTHDAEFAREYGDRIIELKDGEIIHDSLEETDEQVIYDVNETIENIIQIHNGKRLSQKVITHLNELLIKSDKDVFLTLTDDISYAKNLVPTLQQPKSNQTEKTIQMLPHDGDAFQLKRASLPLSYAIKLAFNSLFKKKFRLIFMTLLFILSLIFVGISTNFSFYDISKVTNLTFKKAGINFVPLEKEGIVECENNYCQYRQQKFTDSEIDSLKTNYPSLIFITNYSRYIHIETLTEQFDWKSYSKYYTQELNQITIIDEAKHSFSIRTGEYPEHNEVMLTDYMAEMLLYFNGFNDVTTIDQIVGKKLVYNEKELVISGFVKTDYDKYDILKNSEVYNKLTDEFLQKRQTDYRQIFMTKETYETDFQPYNAHLYMKTDQEKLYGFSSTGYRTLPSESLIPNSRLPERDDEIVLSKNTFDTLFNVHDESQIEQYLGQSITLNHRIESYGDSKFEPVTYTIVGIINGYSDFDIMFTNEQFKKYLNLSGQQDQIFLSVKLGDNDQENISFIKDLTSLKIRHNSNYSSMLYMLKDVIKTLKNVPLIIGLVFITFTALLIFTFISSSIRNRQKEIGTLRAIGARGIDVSKIFITEGVIIAIFSSIIANIGIYIIIFKINQEIMDQYNVPLVLLYFNTISILIVIGLSLVVMFIASFIPIKRITMMKPINAIKNLK